MQSLQLNVLQIRWEVGSYQYYRLIGTFNKEVLVRCRFVNFVPVAKQYREYRHISFLGQPDGAVASSYEMYVALKI